MQPTARQKALAALLDRLGVGSGNLVYVHTSFGRLGHLGLTPNELIEGLCRHVGHSGTVVLPSFAWHVDPKARPWKGYADYFAIRPPFDVRHTPANIGLIPELFRNWPGVLRSAHYWWSIAARGPLAETITRDQVGVEYPYGPDSAFGRMRTLGVKVLGLGVSLNTTSLAPVVDHELGDRHPQEVLTSELQDGVVIDQDGRRRLTRSYWLLPDVVRLIKPSALIEQSRVLAAAVLRADYEDTIQFLYPFSAYFTEGLRLGAEAGARGAKVPWLTEYSLMRTDAHEHKSSPDSV